MAVEAEDLAARLKAEFPHALSNGQVVARYQPEVELSSGRVVAAESLALGASRVRHPAAGPVHPGRRAARADRRAHPADAAAVIAEFLRAERVPGRILALEVSEQTATAAVSISFFARLTHPARPRGPGQVRGQASRRPIPPSPDPGPGAAAGPATAVPPAWAERQVPNGRAPGPDAR
jgi:hypothetical protein